VPRTRGNSDMQSTSWANSVEGLKKQRDELLAKVSDLQADLDGVANVRSKAELLEVSLCCIGFLFCDYLLGH
jgi:hypothetical protein